MPSLNDIPNFSLDEPCVCWNCRFRRNEVAFDIFGSMDTSYDDSYDDDVDEFGLLEWNYHPNFKFRGDDSKTFYGVEFEISCSNIAKALATVRKHDGENLLYMKRDGSVEGFEMVTHPMTFAWALENFPWDLFDEFQPFCSIYEEGNGIHVHVSRTGFSSPSHQYRWMKLWYRNQRKIIEIAGRDCSWGRFDRECRKGQFYHVKPNKSYRDREMDTTTYRRYSAINTTNDATYEVRVFASTLRKEIAKARIGLVASSVEYTRHLTSNDVSLKHGWSWDSYIDWVARQQGFYEDFEKLNRQVNS